MTVQSFREAVRSLRRSPLFTVSAVGSLGVAIGLACSVFAVAQTIFLAPLPYASPETLIELWETAEPGSDQLQDYLQPARMAEWIEYDWRTMERVAVNGLGNALIEQTADGPIRVWVSAIDGDWFNVMGIPASRGRVLTPDDLRPGAPPAAVVSDRFRRDRDDVELGATLTLSGTAFTVVGVMPPSFAPEAKLWVPAESLPTASRPAAYAGVGRLRGGQTVDAARAEVHQQSATDLADDPDRFGGMGVTAKALGAQARRPEKPALWILAGVVTGVLLIGLSNLTQLFLVRAQARGSGLAVRAAMGGSPWQIGRTLAVESALIGVLGSALGIILSVRGVDVVVAFLSSRYPFRSDPTVDGWTLGLAVLLGTLAAVMVGLEPLRRVASLDLQNVLQRRTGGSVSTKGERRTRDFMVGIQVATSLVLVAVTAVMASAYSALAGLDLGYDADQVVMAEPDYEVLEMQTAAQWDVARAVAARLERDPAVSGVAVWQEVGEDYPPRPEWDLITDGPEVELARGEGLYRYTLVEPGTLEATGIGVLRGRTVTADDVAGSERVVLVSERGASLWWPGEEPLGRRIRLGEWGEWMTVVGITENAQMFRELGRNVASSGRPPMPMAYIPAAQLPTPPTGWREFGCCAGVMVAARGMQSTGDVASSLRREFAAVAPELPLARVGSLLDLDMSGYLGGSIAVTGRLVGLGAIVAVALALIGIVGVVSEGIARRTREFGLRIALGARARDVIGVAAWEGLLTAAAGLVVGLIVTGIIDLTASSLIFDYFVLRLTNGLLDAPLLLSVSAGMLVSTLGAIVIVARRAVSVDPTIALRSE